MRGSLHGEGRLPRARLGRTTTPGLFEGSDGEDGAALVAMVAVLVLGVCLSAADAIVCVDPSADVLPGRVIEADAGAPANRLSSASLGEGAADPSSGLLPKVAVSVWDALIATLLPVCCL